MKTRVLTSIFIIAILGLFFGLRQLNTYLFDILIGIILVCGSAEISRVFIRSKKFNNMSVITIFPIFYYLGFLFALQRNLNIGFYFLIEITLLVIFSLITFIWTLCDKKTFKIELGDEKPSKYVINKVLLTTFIMIYPSFLLGNMFILNHISEMGWFVNDFNSNLGLFVLLTLFSTTMLTDTFAYLVGNLIKGPKLCPYISPKKTISGAIGGLIGGICVSVIAFLIANNIGVFNTYFVNNNITVLYFVIYGIIGSIFTQIGDIFASWLKRKALTKDFSSIFPGHGGFMDRCDGLSFNVLIILIFALICFA